MGDARVLILADYADVGGAASGGAGVVVSQSHQALRAAGVSADLVTAFGDVGPAGTSLGGSDLRVAGQARQSIWNTAAREAVAALLAGYDPADTVVILHQWTRWLSPASIGLLGAFPTLVYCHDHFWACPNGAYYHFPHGVPCDRQPLGPRCLTTQCDRAGAVMKLGRVARQAALVAARRSPERPRVLLHVSERARRLMLDLMPGERHEVVHNPLAVPFMVPQPASSATYDLGYVGRLEPEKGVMQLAQQAVANRWSVLFVGEGSCADQLARLPGISIRGWMPRDDVAATMRTCGIMALPSLWPETWGLTVAEAMAARVPVLVSGRAGSAELVERFGGGRVFDPGRPGDLAAKVKSMRAAPPRVLESTAAFREMLSPERHARQIIAIARRHFHIELGPVRAPRSAAPAIRPVALPQRAR